MNHESYGSLNQGSLELWQLFDYIFTTRLYLYSVIQLEGFSSSVPLEIVL